MGKHSPIPYEKYFAIHARCLEDLKSSGVIRKENLKTDQLENCLFKMRGEVLCRGNLLLKVGKTLRAERTISGIITIQAIKYEYNLRFVNGSNVFRYDNAHPHTYLGHTSAFHVHRFNPLGHEQPGSPFEIANEEDWPTLTEVLQEVDEYYWSNLFSPSNINFEDIGSPSVQGS